MVNQTAVTCRSSPRSSRATRPTSCCDSFHGCAGGGEHPSSGASPISAKASDIYPRIRSNAISNFKNNVNIIRSFLLQRFWHYRHFGKGASTSRDAPSSRDFAKPTLRMARIVMPGRDRASLYSVTGRTDMPRKRRLLSLSTLLE